MVKPGRGESPVWDSPSEPLSRRGAGGGRVDAHAEGLGEPMPARALLVGTGKGEAGAKFPATLLQPPDLGERRGAVRPRSSPTKSGTSGAGRR